MEGLYYTGFLRRFKNCLERIFKTFDRREKTQEKRRKQNFERREDKGREKNYKPSVSERVKEKRRLF